MKKIDQLIEAQKELTEAIKILAESNRLLVDALSAENEQEEVQPDSYLDGTSLEL